MKKLLLSAGVILMTVPAFANNIITAEHPPFGDKGYALQFDNRLIYSRADKLVDRDGNKSDKETILTSDLFIARLYIPDWMFRISIPYSQLAVNNVSRSDIGDVNLEAGASREFGDWRLRALLYASVPTSSYDDTAGAINVGSNAWAMGPAIYLTRYLADKKYDLNFWAQYTVNFANPATHVKAGNVFAYAAAASVLTDPGVPMRAAIEQRGLFGDANEVRDSSRGQWGKTQLSVGPSLFINLNKYVRGFQLWPTAQFDFYNRNTQKTSLYYLKLQYNW